VRLLAGGDNLKVLMQGKVFIALKPIFTQPCSQAPKAYIVMFGTIAQKLTAKIEKTPLIQAKSKNINFKNK
jgi:hypothetical protein